MTTMTTTPITTRRSPNIENNDYNNSNNNNNKTSSYPTGNSIPFPYETPYPQQIDLMDALLQGLRNTTTNIEDRRSTEEEKTLKAKTSILLLESPTGTGKSLSLACASIAWLKYQESLDLEVSSSSSSSNNDGSKHTPNRKESSSTTTPTTSPTGLDWLDSYQPMEVKEEEEMTQKIQATAKQARTELSQELSRIKLQYNNNNNNNRSSSSSSSSSSNDRDKERCRQRRENSLRSAITTAKLRQRQHYRKMGRVIRRRRMCQNSTTSNTAKENDFCLPNYCSNPEDNDDDDDDDNIYNDNERIQSVASKLLNGSRLDGSIIYNNKKYQKSSSSSFSTSTKSHSKNSHTNSTNTNRYEGSSSCCGGDGVVGGVEHGSGVRKIIYAARTHSQLSQFINEVKRTKWGSSIRLVALGSRTSGGGLCGHFRSTTKKPLSEAYVTDSCLDLQRNKKSNNKTTTTTTNGKRTRVSNKSSTGGCPLYDQEAINTLALHMLAQPTDIEETAQLGIATSTCSYYASRAAVAAAELVVVPYSMLLSSSTRESIGLSLQNSIVLIDEAHNLPEVIRSLHSCSITLPTVQAALDQLVTYTSKYIHRLGGRNLFLLGQLRKVCSAVVQHLKKQQQIYDDDLEQNNKKQQQKQSPKNTTPLVSPSEFLIQLELDSINLFQLLRYMKQSRLSQKLLGFMNHCKSSSTSCGDGDDTNKATNTAEHDNNAASADIGLSKHVSPMSVVETFLEKLTLTSEQGKVVTDRPKKHPRFIPPTLRYVLLHPAACCQDLFEEPHALCLVGGTLRPFAFVVEELFDDTNLVQVAADADDSLQQKQLGRQRKLFQRVIQSHSNDDDTWCRYMTAFTCDHVVSPSNVLLQSIATVDTTTLDLRYPARSTSGVCDALGRTVLNICQRVPHGIVVFLPSYSYESHLIQYWMKTKMILKDRDTKISTTIYDALQKSKSVFREPKSSSQVEVILDQYSKAAMSSSGALLFSVIGGKLSEGINFANDMARAVIVLGLPYPDPTDPVLVEKMTLLDDRRRRQQQQQQQQQQHPTNSVRTSYTSSASMSTTKLMTSKAYYQNLCMRAVNQSVGRAIRHANDYAAIVLVDARYQRDNRIIAALPEWLTTTKRKIQEQQEETSGTLNEALKRIESFFSVRKGS